MKHRMMMTAAVLSTASFLATGAGVLTYQSLAAEKPTPPAAKQPADKEKTEQGLSLAEFTKLHKELQLKSQPWATIPWQLSLTEGRQQAAREKKPIFLMTGTGHLLCLG